MNAAPEHPHGPVADMPARVGRVRNNAIPTAQEQMKALGKTYEPVTYEGAGHGFMRSGEDPEGSEPNRKGRNEAWTRWKALLAKL